MQQQPEGHKTYARGRRHRGQTHPDFDQTSNHERTSPVQLRASCVPKGRGGEFRYNEHCFSQFPLAYIPKIQLGGAQREQTT